MRCIDEEEEGLEDHEDVVCCRVIPIILLAKEGMVKTCQFKGRRPLDAPRAAIRNYDARQVDETVIIDLDTETAGPDLKKIGVLADECFMPLAIGGGIWNLSQIKDIIRTVADKVVINTGALQQPTLIEQASKMFGSQSVMVALDVKDGRVWSNSGAHMWPFTATSWAKKAEECGAGELLITAIDKEGMMGGYDLNLIADISSAVSIPVIANGGAGEPRHCLKAIQAGAQAVAMSSIFHYTQWTPRDVKLALKQGGVNVRL